MANEYVETTLMDGFAGGPHITEEQTGVANQGLYGPDDYVLEGGRQAEAQVLTNNSIRIFDAVFVIQGRRDVIAANDYTDVSIDNGAQGMNRNDIIVRRYTKDESSEIENTEYAVIKGASIEGEAVDPEVTVGDIRSGALLHEMKLYRVRLEGINIVAVEPLFKVLLNMSTINASLSELIGKFEIIAQKKTKDNRINVSTGQKATSHIIIDAIDGYTPVLATVWSSHITTTTSDARIVGDMVMFYFDAAANQTPETFTAEILYIKDILL